MENYLPGVTVGIGLFFLSMLQDEKSISATNPTETLQGFCQ